MMLHALQPLSSRLRPDVEAAPWVIKEIEQLEAEVQALRYLVNTVMAIPNMTDEQLEELKRNCYTIISTKRGQNDQG